jgi:hypothetical protein
MPLGVDAGDQQPQGADGIFLAHRLAVEPLRR